MPAQEAEHPLGRFCYHCLDLLHMVCAEKLQGLLIGLFEASAGIECLAGRLK